MASIMKLAVITGSSVGIGLATAEKFLDESYEVINLSRRKCPVQGIRNITCDLGHHGFLDGVQSELRSSLERADSVVLVHNAARYENDTARTMSSPALREVFEVNLVGPNTLNGFVIPHMSYGSAIVFIGSTLSEKAVPSNFSYVTSKHAQVGMMRALCQDLAGTGIHTACVCPGFTNTEMLRSHVPESAMSEIRAISAFGRLIEPEEIASVVYWVAQNPVVNGSMIHANLGQVEQ